MSQELCTCKDGAFYLVDGKALCCNCRKEVPEEDQTAHCTGPYADLGGQRIAWMAPMEELTRPLAWSKRRYADDAL